MFRLRGVHRALGIARLGLVPGAFRGRGETTHPIRTEEDLAEEDLQVVIRESEEGDLVSKIVRPARLQSPGERAFPGSARADEHYRRSSCRYHGAVQADTAAFAEQETHETE